VARPVPPLNPLHVFEVASRLGSFTKAAKTLGVTPSAVSRQIATLEAFLNVRLFHRGRDGNTLTDVGARYFEDIAPGFEIISRATELITRSHDAEPLNVRVPSTFAVQFLIPRLSQFKAEHPHIGIRMITGFGPVDFVREHADVSIQVNLGAVPNSEGTLLLPNWVQPLCSPSLFKGRHPLRTHGDLQHQRLLFSRNRPTDWQDWLVAVDCRDVALDRAEMIEFPNSMLAIQAAADGLGVVIGQVPLLGKDFSSHPLVPLFSPPVRQGSFYAVWQAGTDPNLKTRQFISWLQKQLKPLIDELPVSPADKIQAKRKSGLSHLV
jgi:LysR family glycine cleavage system transcriptional activator